ncbi:thiamine phosphate synthase [Methyloversatilis sp. XJ19-49]|uniref:thiamine phosphate synthase n=1 Tax=Methyloversatilis sp. XJ19-49 TaxID=2963429 RepID=UPI00211BC9F5|nr:thiamine phosphate synthase [Methyloversatilis sp. XJ19-49]MCQ9377068.1 thiamine phosphate synthase [Methyloversatilis sp. XJ19-49]
MPGDLLPLRGLYAVTPEALSGAALYRAAEAACAGGAVLLQYRNKSHNVACRLADALALRAITTVCGTRFIVNDDVELAREVGADGVHVGREDGDPAAARRRLGPAALIGVSCYNDAGLAHEARRAGADYVAFGAMFASATKPAAPVADRARFAEVADLGIARCAIGGITLDRAPRLIEAGADLLAVVSDLFDAPDISARARAYAQLF